MGLDLVRFGRLPMPFCGACGAKLDGVPAGSLCPNCQMKGVPPPPALNPNAPPAAAVAMAQPLHVVQNASTVQQQMGSAGSVYPPPNSGQWSTGFCDCCAMVRSPQGVEVGGAGLCCKAFFCLCCVIGDNSEFFANHEGVHCAGQGNSSNACCMWCAAEHLAHFVVGVPLGCMLHLPIPAQSVGAMGCPRTLASTSVLFAAVQPAPQSRSTGSCTSAEPRCARRTVTRQTSANRALWRSIPCAK